MTRHFDYLAIGGGSGGIASINRAAMYGQKCALIEAKELGGTCVNVGCVPKKVMWHAAQIAEAIHLYGPDYGFDTTVNRFDWSTLVKNRSAYIDRIHTAYEEAGILDDTLFIVTADHGGNGTSHGGWTDGEKYIMWAAS